MYKIKNEDNYLIVFLVFLAIISLLIIKNFVILIVFTGILVYLFQPLYDKLIKIIPSHFIVSFLMIILMISILIIPVSLIVLNITNEISSLQSPNIYETLDIYSQKASNQFSMNIDFKNDYEQFLMSTNNYLKDSIIMQIPKIIFNLFIIMFLFYYFLKSSKRESTYVRFILKKEKFRRIINKTTRLLEGIVFGQILVRFIQAFVASILFFLIDIDGYIILGFLVFFAAFIPILGTTLVWGPLLLINLINQNYQLSLYILIVGIIVATIDNFLLPYFISEKTNIGPVVTLLSILGGIQLFGFYGIILGPFFLGLFFVFFDELILKLRNDSPTFKRYIWSKEEREKYYKLKSKSAKLEFARILEQRYKLEEFRGKKTNYRYEEEKKTILRTESVSN